MGFNVFKKIAELIDGKQNKPEVIDDAPEKKVVVTPEDEVADHAKTVVYTPEDVESNQAKTIADKPQPSKVNTEAADANKAQAFSGMAASNSIDKKGDLLNAVKTTLEANYKGSSISFADKELTLWVNDGLFYNSLVSQNFKEELMTTVFNELGFDFAAVKLANGTIPDDNATTQIMKDCYLYIYSSTEKVTSSKAVIYQTDGFGSIIGGEVAISSGEIQKLPQKRYNIGIGRQPEMSDGGHRVNHIAVDDNPASEDFMKNRYVSRAHAHISYSEESGFLLYAEHGGTRVAHKRTHIYRGEEKIELDNILVPVILEDGDYIVLSKYVHLLFKNA